MIKGVIFDLDGVIVSTDSLHYNAWKKLADSEGIYFDEKINNRLRGVSRMESLDIILEKSNAVYSNTEKKMLAEIKNSTYVDLLDTLTESDIIDGIVSLCSDLKKRNIKIAIGSSSKNARLILRKLKLEFFFDAICDGNNIAISKPNPEVFLKAAKMLDLEPQECCVVEDALSGVEAAISANMMVFGVGEALKSNHKVYSLVKILNILDNINDN